MADNTEVHIIRYNGQEINTVDIATDTILDPIMYENKTIKDYFDEIIDADDEDLHDPTIIVYALTLDGQKRSGMTTWSRLTFPRLTSNEYNKEKFEKLYLKCNNNVDWPQASNQADLELGLLMSMRLQFPPLSEGFIRWADLYKYLMVDSDVNKKIYTKDGKSHEYYIIPLKITEDLPGVVSYSFYIHQTVFERNPVYIDHATNLGLFDNEWNVSASHCQPENNKRYVILDAEGTEVVNSPELFPLQSEEFTRWIQTPIRRQEELPVITPSEADEIVEALRSDDEEEGPSVARNLNDAFDQADDEDLDIINIYTDDQSELSELVESYCEDKSSTVNIYGNPDEWRIAMHNYERPEFTFEDFEDDDDDDDDEDDDEEESEDEERGPRLTMDDLANSPTEDVPTTPVTEPALRTPTTPVREPREPSERPVMSIDEFEGMIYKNREDWLEGEDINLAQETIKNHRENIIIKITNREELNKAFKFTRDMIKQANDDEDQIDAGDMDEEIHPYLIGNTPYKFDWDVSEVEDFSKLGTEFFDTAKLATDSIPLTAGHYWPKNLSDWDMSSAVDLSEMFKGCTNFEHISLKNWGDKLGNVRDASSMFEGCTEYDDDLSSWNVSSFTMIDNMFKHCHTFDGDLSSWSMPNLISCSGFIRGNYPEERLPSEIFDKECMQRSSDEPVREPTEPSERRVMSIDDYERMIMKDFLDWFQGKDIDLAQETIKHHRDNIIIRLRNRRELNKALGLTKGCFKQINANQDKIDAGDMGEEINDYYIENTPYKFDWDVSGVVDFSKLGEDFVEIAELASESIGDDFYSPKNLENWDMSSAVDLSEMFKDCLWLIETISLKNWGDKLGNVINASGMFEGCTEYDDDLSSWDVSSFTMIDNMFKNCYTFNGDFSTWTMPNLISCSGFIRSTYPQEKLPSEIFDKGCMQRSSDEQSDEERDELFLAGGGDDILDKKIMHLENYITSRGLYYLPTYILNDLKK